MKTQCIVHTCKDNGRRVKGFCMKHYCYNRLYGHPEVKDEYIAPLKLVKHESAWLAAFIDGEGYIGVVKSNPVAGGPTYLLRLTISNTHRGVMDYICKLTQLGRIQTCPPGKHGLKIQYKWEIYATYDIKRIIKTVYPYLIVKKWQAREALKFPVKYSRSRLIREKFYFRLRRLNSRHASILATNSTTPLPHL